MSKARARERAKANALKKAKRRAANKDKPEQNIPPGQFDAGDTSVKGPGVTANVTNLGAAKRGASRSG